MIKRTNQNWAIGQTVKVGFMQLVVVAAKATPGDFKPDAYLLESSKGVFYSFVPHNGLTRLDSRGDF